MKILKYLYKRKINQKWPIYFDEYNEKDQRTPKIIYISIIGTSLNVI